MTKKKNQKKNYTCFYFYKDNEDKKNKCIIEKRVNIINHTDCPECHREIKAGGQYYIIKFDSFIPITVNICRICLNNAYMKKGQFCIEIPENYTPKIIDESIFKN